MRTSSVIKGLLAGLFMALVIYLCGSLGNASFNVTDWSSDGRTGVSIAIFFFSMITVIGVTAGVEGKLKP